METRQTVRSRACNLARIWNNSNEKCSGCQTRASWKWTRTGSNRRPHGSEPQFAISNCRIHGTQVTGDFIAGQLKRLIVDYGTSVDCEINDPFPYLYHEGRDTNLRNCNIIKFEMDLIRGISRKWTVWQYCQAVFCLFLLGIWKKWRKREQIRYFYSAKGVRISLGDRLRVFRKTPGYHVVLEIVQSSFP